jgi:hypothetical protein
MCSAIKPQIITPKNFDINNLKFGGIKNISGNNVGKSANLWYLGGPFAYKMMVSTDGNATTMPSLTSRLATLQNLD